MIAKLGRGSGKVKSQVDDRIGKFRLLEDLVTRQETFDLQFNAFETGCVMRWLERRWSRAEDFAGSSFFFQNNTLHVQFTQTTAGNSSPASLSFEAWMRRLARMGDQ